MPSRSEAITTMPPAQQAYSFLSQPPTHKKWSAQHAAVPSDVPPRTQAENARRRSIATISNWASSVQPGPPAPLSPSKANFANENSSSSSKHRSARRHSVMPSPPSPVAYLPESPTSSDHTVTGTQKHNVKPDLQAVGYTSVFVTLPKTPPAEYTPDGRVLPRAPNSAVPPTTAESSSRMSRFRSLSLKPHSRSKSVSAPSSSKPKPPPTHASVTKEKRSKYAEMRPPQLATELALAQLTGGGTLEHHMKQYSEKQAKHSGAAKMVNGQLVGVGQVWQDGQGGIWRDQEEEWEYTHLLGGASRDAAGSGEIGWVQFSGENGDDEDRRGSVSTVDSDLDPRYAVTADSAAPHVPAQHLRKSPEFDVNIFSGSGSERPRRRPEPLNLAPTQSARAVFDTAAVREDFLQASFSPAAPVRVPTSQSSSSINTTSTSTKRSALKPVMNIFRVGSKKPSRA